MAGKKEGVTSMCMSAEEWSATEGKVDRVVIRGALHRFTRWQGVSSNHIEHHPQSQEACACNLFWHLRQVDARRLL